MKAANSFMPEGLKLWFRRYQDILYPAMTIASVYVVMFLLGITCPIKFVTGISCPGCGMTRAWLSVLRLDFAGAVRYHPLFVLPPIAAVVYFLKSHINRNIYRAIMLTMAGAFIIMYACRLIFAEGDVVVFQPDNNILFRLWELRKK